MGFTNALGTNTLKHTGGDDVLRSKRFFTHGTMPINSAGRTAIRTARDFHDFVLGFGRKDDRMHAFTRFQRAPAKGTRLPLIAGSRVDFDRVSRPPP